MQVSELEFLRSNKAAQQAMGRKLRRAALLMRAIVANGVTLHVHENGDPDGAPVVFANSLGTDLRLWDALIPLLPKGLRLIRYGHARSRIVGMPCWGHTRSTTSQTMLRLSSKHLILVLLHLSACRLVG